MRCENGPELDQSHWILDTNQGRVSHGDRHDDERDPVAAVSSHWKRVAQRNESVEPLM